MAVGWAQALPVGGVPEARDAYYPVSCAGSPFNTWHSSNFKPKESRTVTRVVGTQ